MDKAELNAFIQPLTKALLEVAELAGSGISPNLIKVEPFLAPHKKPSEEATKLVYVFLHSDTVLKVGMSVGRARGTRLNNNYNPRVPGTLAERIHSSKDVIKQVCPQEMHSEIDQLTPWKKHIRSWMEKNLTLITFRFDERTNDRMILLFEVFLQCKLNPLLKEGRT